MCVGHPHSPAPPSWPALADVIKYRDAVRQRLQQVYDNHGHDKAAMPMQLQHVIWMAYEHEAMHLETLLYMVLQLHEFRPPPEAVLIETTGSSRPGWVMKAKGRHAANGNSDSAAASGDQAGVLGHEMSSKEPVTPFVEVPAGWVEMGMPDVDTSSPIQLYVSQNTPTDAKGALSTETHLTDESQGPKHGYAQQQESQKGLLGRFGWDNERPARRVYVETCSLQSTPVTVGQYHRFFMQQLEAAAENIRQSEGEQHHQQKQDKTHQPSSCASAVDRVLSALLPASWVMSNEQGARSHEPLATAQVRTVFGPVHLGTAWDWPVYISQLQAQAYADWVGMRLPTEPELLLAKQHMQQMQSMPAASASLHVSNSMQANGSSIDHDVPCENDRLAVDFHTWHPVDVDINPPAGVISQLGSNGWELTDSLFESHSGFAPDAMYPEYSADFFDGKHVVLLGASWATVGKIADRPTFRNWYQRGYPYVFAKFRLCKK